MIAGIASAGLFVVIAIALWPLAFSESRLRGALSSHLSEVTGQTVLLSGEVELDLLPLPSITMSNVLVPGAEDEPGAPAMVADAVKADLGLASVLSGSPQFSSVLLEGPDFRLDLFADGTTNWNAAAAEPDDTGSTATVGFGSVAIVNGSLTVVEHAEGKQETLSAINGDITWPRIGTGARADLAAIWRGEPVRIDVGTDRPAEFLAGGSVPLRISVQSELLSFDYSGKIGFRPTLAITGEITLRSPSVRRALRWSGTEIGPGEAIGALSLEGAVQGGASGVGIQDLVIDIDGNRGVGALDFAWSDNGRPSLSGTLAYDRLNIGAFLEAFTPLPDDGSDIARTIDTGFLRQVGLDLRLSAQEASLGALTFSGLGAAARVESGRAIFDIGQANAFGGTVLGRVAIAEDGFDGGGEIQLSAQGVDFGAIMGTFDITGPLPRGIGTLNLNLTSKRPIWATSLDTITGTLDVTMGNGTIPNLDLTAFRRLYEEERFFEISGASGAPLAFNRAHFVASFANGTAELTTGQIELSDRLLVLAGLIPYQDGSLAMSGALTDLPAASGAGEDAVSAFQNSLEGQDAVAAQPLRFFIGGSWPSPVISPIK